jgi:hypothetical protein
MIKCIKFKPFEKNTLKGFADLELTRVGIVIHDCCWHVRDGAEWISFPARQYKDRDGHATWARVIDFAEDAGGDIRQAFKEQALAAIHAVAKETTP